LIVDSLVVFKGSHIIAVPNGLALLIRKIVVALSNFHIQSLPFSIANCNSHSLSYSNFNQFCGSNSQLSYSLATPHHQRYSWLRCLRHPLSSPFWL